MSPSELGWKIMFLCVGLVAGWSASNVAGWMVGNVGQPAEAPARTETPLRCICSCDGDAAVLQIDTGDNGDTRHETKTPASQAEEN